MPNKYMKFDGKNFELETHVFSKKEAEEHAKSLRRKGFLARIVKDTTFIRGTAYAIYVRRKTYRKPKSLYKYG